MTITCSWQQINLRRICLHLMLGVIAAGSGLAINLKGLPQQPINIISSVLLTYYCQARIKSQQAKRNCLQRPHKQNLVHFTKQGMTVYEVVISFNLAKWISKQLGIRAPNTLSLFFY